MSGIVTKSTDHWQTDSYTVVGADRDTDGDYSHASHTERTPSMQRVLKWSKSVGHFQMSLAIPDPLLLLINLSLFLFAFYYHRLLNHEDRDIQPCSIDYPSPPRLKFTVTGFVSNAEQHLDDIWTEYLMSLHAQQYHPFGMHIGRWWCPAQQIQCYKYARLAGRATVVGLSNNDSYLKIRRAIKQDKTLDVSYMGFEDELASWQNHPQMRRALFQKAKLCPKKDDRFITEKRITWQNKWDFICDNLFDVEDDDEVEDERDCYRKDIVTIGRQQCPMLFEPDVTFSDYYLYFKLNNFHANNAYFRTSFSAKQLKGTLIDASDSELSSCSSYRTASDLKHAIENGFSTSFDVPPVEIPLGDKAILHPCGVLPTSIFTDQFHRVKLCESISVIAETTCCKDNSLCLTSTEDRPDCCSRGLPANTCISNLVPCSTSLSIDDIPLDTSIETILPYAELGSQFKNVDFSEKSDAQKYSSWLPDFIFGGEVEDAHFINWVTFTANNETTIPFAKMDWDKTTPRVLDTIDAHLQIRIKNRYAAHLYGGTKELVVSKLMTKDILFDDGLIITGMVICGLNCLYLSLRILLKFCPSNQSRFDSIKNDLAYLCHYSHVNTSRNRAVDKDCSASSSNYTTSVPSEPMCSTTESSQRNSESEDSMEEELPSYQIPTSGILFDNILPDQLFSSYSEVSHPISEQVEYASSREA